MHRRQAPVMAFRGHRWRSEPAVAGEVTVKFGYDARLLIGTVAQLVEQGPFKALVLGSSPSRPTIKSMGYVYLSFRGTEIIRKTNGCRPHAEG